MIQKLSTADKASMQRTYSKMDDGVGKCTPGCNRCCNDMAITYMEFLYLASGFNEDELQAIASKSKTVIRDADTKTGEGLTVFHGQIALGANPNLGKVVYYCPVFDLDSRKCAAYDERPWQCRAFQRYDDGRCMTVVRNDILTRNAYVHDVIEVANNAFAPPELRSHRTVRGWLGALL